MSWRLCLAFLLTALCAACSQEGPPESQSSSAASAPASQDDEAGSSSSSGTVVPGVSATVAPGVGTGGVTDDHGDDWQHASSLGVGEAVAGVVGDMNDTDCFAVTLLAGQRYACRAHSFGQLSLELNDTDGRSVLLQAAPGESWVAFEPTAPGTYYLKVRCEAGAQIRYHMVVEPQ